MRRWTGRFGVGLVLMNFFGCAHQAVQENQNPDELIQNACSPGSQISQTEGSIWLSFKSKENSGRFPALVKSKEGQELDMEVTNLLGGTEARIKVRGNEYEVEIPGKKTSTKKTQYWRGIPLKWASSLFLGRVPCPVDHGRDALAELRMEDGSLLVETKPDDQGLKEKFVYQFKNWDGKKWPEKLHWERSGAEVASVDFLFEDPEDGTLSPRRWEANSIQGEVKMRWKERRIVQKN